MSRIDKFGLVIAMVIASASVVPIARAQQSIQKSLPDTSAEVEKILPGGFKMELRPIDFDQERIDLTLAYRRIHQDPHAKDILIQPKMIILHWTGINSLESTWNYFNRTRAEAARSQLAAAGEVNVSAHFLVDRDGAIFRLMPETWMARHCIGLNQVAIGIENVGDGEKFPLTNSQAKANAALVRYLKARYPIEYLIGHMEYRHMEGTALFAERDPKYRNSKPDPGTDFMRKVRALVKDLKLQEPPR